MKSLSGQPSTLHCNLLARGSPTPLTPPKNHVFLAHLRTSSTDYIAKNHVSLTQKSRLSGPSPAPAEWNNYFVAPNNAFTLKRQAQGKCLKVHRSGANFDVHSLKEQVIEIPIETVVIDDLKMVIEGQLFIKVVDPSLATGDNNLDLVSAVTQSIEKTLPIRSMIKEMVFHEKVTFLNNIYKFGCIFAKNNHTPDFEIFRVYGYLYDEFFNHPGFEVSDDINKITMGWGVKCLRFKIRFYMANEMLPTHEDMVVEKTERMYKMWRQKTDRIFRAVMELRDYYDDKDI